MVAVPVHILERNKPHVPLAGAQKRRESEVEIITASRIIFDYLDVDSWGGYTRARLTNIPKCVDLCWIQSQDLGRSKCLATICLESRE